ELLKFLEKAKEPLKKYVFTAEGMENIDSSYKLGRPNKRKAVESNVERSDEENPSGSKKKRVSKPATASWDIKDNKTIKSGGSTQRRSSERLAIAAQVLEGEGETSKSRGPNKRRAVESVQIMEEDKPNGSRQ
ncbi:hypothetical protein BGZ46_006750, partial [Entomortierella lignicola]